MKFRFNFPACCIFLFLLLTEVLIALYVHDKIIRPYIGDVLVVVLIYYFIKAFFEIQPVKSIVAVFLFACLVEAAQYANLVHHLGLDDNRFWVIVIGNSFHWLDIAAYAAGSVLTFITERYFRFAAGKKHR